MKKEFRVDTALYSEEALGLAANVAGAGAAPGKRGKVSIEAEDPEAAFREFMNEALSQQCRIDLVKRNFKASQLILTNALVSALGRKNDAGGGK
ncbi:MAG: hypothetical protein FD189_243 [Elusimicrobia bacterium]|nr:MAG: hypothetical protein FD154_43 [Elusimicrobiota bacterium]KAF0157976.1 MAG: hypothetical protein FD189_243 [Elusimicrobiota bacterium]